ncbi:MAG: Zn-dependent hydrolase [Ignavibacteria bacterium]|nr:Zn-dependent hydrolase [Ignavibacteria bacterium]
MKQKNLFLLLFIIFFTANLTYSQTMTIKEKVKRYKPVTLSADLSWMTDNEKKIIPILVEISNIMDDLFWMQNYGDKESLLSGITDEYEKQFILINYGPWDQLDGNKPFIAGFGDKPKGANLYPSDMSVEEFEKLDDPLKTSLYTIIRRDEYGKLKVIPYSVAYEKELKKASELLSEASKLAENPGLKNYLKLRAEALLTDNYQPSDFEWMDMKTSNIDFVVGPIENYTDGLFGYKTAFEAFLLIKDREWSEKLTKFVAVLPEIQSGLPVNEIYKTERPASGSDLNVYDAIYYAGDCNAGSKTIAINLPNDEEVQLKKGARRLQLKNIMKAKFDNIVIPIADLLITPEQRKYVKFNAFFENTMFHEVAHGLGIKNTVTGTGTVREALKEQYSALEEGKADILGLYIVTKLYEMDMLSEGEIMDNYTTFLAGIFRSCRFGAASAHGKANMMRFYYFQDKGAFSRYNNGTYSVNFEKMKDAVISSVQQILRIQGDGDYDAAKYMIEKDGYIKEELQADLNRINASGIPVDIVFNMGPEYIKF